MTTETQYWYCVSASLERHGYRFVSVRYGCMVKYIKNGVGNQ